MDTLEDKLHISVGVIIKKDKNIVLELIWKYWFEKLHILD